MKQFIILLVALLTLGSTGAEAKVRTVTERDSLGNTKRVIELRDTLINGKVVSDTVSITSYEGIGQESEQYKYKYSNSMDWDFNFDEEDTKNIPGFLLGIIAFTVIFGIFVLPFAIILLPIFLYFKNRRAKLRLAEKAIEAGQPIPAEHLKSLDERDNRTRGIKNICLGIGLSIFLYALTDEFAIASIGILVMCTGIGQLIIYYTTPKK